MAKATKVIHRMEIDPEVKYEQELRDLENLLLENKDVLYDIFSVLDKLRDRELFNIANGALGQGEQVMHRIVTAIDDSETPQSIKNVLLLSQLLGTLNMDEIEPMVLKFNSGIAKAAEYEHEAKPAGYTGILSALKDPEVIEGLNVMIKIVKGMGTAKDDEEKVEPQKERVRKPEKEMNQQVTKTRRSAPSKKMPKWYVFVPGTALLLLPLLLKQR